MKIPVQLRYPMMGFFLLLTALMVPFSQGFGQAREDREKLPYKPPKFLYEEKCSKCHTLERVFAEPKTEGEWQACVSRMMKKSKFWITKEDAERIVDEIIGKRKDSVSPVLQRKKYADIKLLFIDRCTRCHTTGRILKKTKTRDEWLETVLRMRDNAPELFLEEDVSLISGFLAERGDILREDTAAQVIEEKCLACHEAGRILLERKSKKEWEKCVTDMRVLARQNLGKDWFTKDECNLIVEVLVKTQGNEQPEE